MSAGRSPGKGGVVHACQQGDHLGREGWFMHVSREITWGREGWFMHVSREITYGVEVIHLLLSSLEVIHLLLSSLVTTIMSKAFHECKAG